MEYVDTHVHLDDARYDADREAVLERARAEGVGTLVSIGTSLEDSRWAAEFVRGREGLHAAVGVHPELASGYDPARRGEFEALLRDPKVVAVGEVGLDAHRPGADLELQERVLRDMLALARGAGRPLVVHVREAVGRLLEVLREDWDPALGGVFHCFSGDLATARAAMDLNFDLAVGGVLTFKNAGALREVVAGVPLERLVLETDGPWLAPQERRGGRNEPAYVPSVARCLAGIKGLPLERVAEQTTANARRLFRLGAVQGGAEQTRGWA